MNSFSERGSGLPANPPAELPDQRRLRLLQLLADARAPISTDDSWETTDLDALAELIARDFVAGEIIRLGPGQINGIHSAILKPAGQAWLAETSGRKPVVPRTSLIRHSPYRFYLSLFGIIAALYLAYHYLYSR